MTRLRHEVARLLRRAEAQQREEPGDLLTCWVGDDGRLRCWSMLDGHIWLMDSAGNKLQRVNENDCNI